MVVQGQPRSLISIAIDSASATYMFVIDTNVGVSYTVLEIRRLKSRTSRQFVPTPLSHIALTIGRTLSISRYTWRDKNASDYPLASTPPGMPGHIPNILVRVGRQWEYALNIITYFKFSTSEFTKICHFEIAKQKNSGVGALPSRSHPLRRFVPPTLNSRWRHWDYLSVK